MSSSTSESVRFNFTRPYKLVIWDTGTTTTFARTRHWTFGVHFKMNLAIVSSILIKSNLSVTSFLHCTQSVSITWGTNMYGWSAMRWSSVREEQLRRTSLMDCRWQNSEQNSFVKRLQSIEIGYSMSVFVYAPTRLTTLTCDPIFLKSDSRRMDIDICQANIAI